MIILCFWSCAPPDAPETLDELGSYLFTELPNPDIRYMEEGVSNLVSWIQENRENVHDGYRIQNLDTAAISTLGLDEDPNLEGLIGAAVATDTGLELVDVLDVIYNISPLEINRDAYGYFNRTWGDDSDCFFAGNCPRTSYYVEVENNLPLGIITQSKMQGEYLYVTIADTTYIAHRRWFVEPASCNQDWLNAEQNYSLSIFMPTDTGLQFMDVEWIVTKLGDVPFPEDFALSMAIGAIRNGRTSLEEYISTNQ